MTKKIFRSILAVSIVAFLVSAVLMPVIIFRYFETQFNDEVITEAEIISFGVAEYGLEYLEQIERNVDILWVDGDGNQLYSTGTTDGENSLLVNYITSEVQLEDGSKIIVSSAHGTIWAVMLQSLWIVATALLIVVIFSVILAKALSRKIVRPINNINLEDPQVRDEYVELSPLLHRIKRQNELITLQLDDLKLRKQEFEDITENMGEALVVIDNSADIITYNKSAKTLFESNGLEYGVSVYKAHEGEEFENAVKGALAGSRCEFELKHGENVYQVFTNPVVVDGKISGALIFVVDITEKAARESMRQEFTSNVSHELKTPLTSISGISEIMMNGIVKPEDVAGFAENIHNEAGRLINLVNDIIKLSQLDENSIPLEKEPVDLLLVAKEVKTRLRHVIAKSDVEFKLIGESAVVEGIAPILSEMLYNLCDNAIKYNKKNGSVELTVGKREGRAFVSVKDTGIGIPREAQSRVFERFYRVDKSHSREIGGTGLGLSIVKHGAAYHGAEVSLYSKLNEGTTVEIVFKA